MFFLNKSLPKSHNVPLLFPYNNVLLKPTEKAGVVMHPSFHTTMFFLNEVMGGCLCIRMWSFNTTMFFLKNDKNRTEISIRYIVSIQQCSS